MRGGRMGGMARPPRLEFEDGVYHVLNRGNYRSPIFHSDKTKAAFLGCLDEACERTGWRVHAWSIMSNHYHLAISTPRANLVDGAQWLQGTFATRFNRFRREQGHLFQGRYKSLIVEPGEGLGPLCHYIHLNPVEAGICPAGALGTYRWTSMSWLCGAVAPPAWYDPQPALTHAGELRWTKAGAEKYLEYLGWLAENEPARKRQRFEAMSKGWIIGTREFTKAVVQEHRELANRGPQLKSELGPAREAVWQEALELGLRQLGRTVADLHRAGKSTLWKLKLAAELRSRNTVTNRWLGQNLHLGARDEVSRKLNAWIRNNRAVPAPHPPLPTDHRA